MDGGASSPATATPSEIESREGCGPLELTRRQRGRIPLRTTLSQIPLKSFGFPGAESARKRFFLRGQAPTPKKSAPGGDQPKSSISLGRSRSACLPFGQATFPPRRSPASIGSREGSHPLALSRGGVLVGILVSDEAGCPFEDVVSDGTGVGRSAPLHPSGDGVREGCDPLALSRGWSMKVGILGEMGIFSHSFWHFAFAGGPAAFILAWLSVYASAQRSTSNMPWVVSFRWGMTGRAMKESVMNGSMPRCAPRA